ncbi:MAG: TIM barrel protein [Planctomycetaceae bacterium]|nr:TIM barrel protein [Planctomycetaceae bacterium]
MTPDDRTADGLPHFNRRRMMQSALAGAAGLSLAAGSSPACADDGEYKIKNGRIRQSIVAWCFKPLGIPQLAEIAKAQGYESIELVPAEHWSFLKDQGLRCAIGSSHGFAKGFAHTEEHEQCLQVLKRELDLAAAHDVPSIITFSGFRRELTTEDGVKNMVAGLKKIVGYAEEKNVTLCLEMLNSRVPVEMKGHPDYFCDDMDLTIDIIKQVGSPRLKVLFDVYHVQIMQGDVITRIKQYHEYVGHYHTAGNPGRNEIDDTQEINYPGIMRAIAETKYDAYVGQEFIPLRDARKSLAEAAQLCDV